MSSAPNTSDNQRLPPRCPFDIAPCEMYFCPMTGNRGSQPSGSRSPARSIELRMRWRVTASPAAGRPRGAQVSGEICDRPRFEGHRRRQTDIRVNRWWFGFADRRRNHRVVDQPEELMGAHRHVHTPRRSPGLQVGRRELSRSGAFRAIRRHLCHGPSTVSATRAASMPRHAESVFASRELGAPSLDESPGRHSPEALASIT